MHLNKPKVFITFILEYLCKQSYLVIVIQVLLYSTNDGACPLNDQRFQTVFVVKIGVHELLHGLNGQLAVPTLFIILNLLAVNVIDNLF